MMKMIKVQDAVGSVLSHDVTQIIPGEFKGRAFKKGHIIKEEDIEKDIDSYVDAFGRTAHCRRGKRVSPTAC